MSFGTIDVSGKRLGLLRELVPQSKVLAALLDTNLVEFDQELRALEAAAKTMDRRLVVVRVSKAQELDAAFVTIVQSGASALHIGSGPLFTSQRQRLVLLSTRHVIPTSYTDREYVAAGGLLSYGPSQLEAYRRAAIAGFHCFPPDTLGVLEHRGDRAVRISTWSGRYVRDVALRA